MQARFGHVNLVARDWRALAAFYETVLGCERVGPERDLAGGTLERALAVPGVRVRGVHLRLPGGGDRGPTLEIFSYDPAAPGPAPAINRPGLGHLAFAVPDVDAARREVLRAGGRDAGELVDLEVKGAGTVRFLYMRDPEGNLLELQRWSG